MRLNLQKLPITLSLLAILLTIPLTVYLIKQKQEVRKRAAPPPNLPDLDVTFLERTPRFDFNGEKKWPTQGETVIFTTHIKNNGALPSGNFNFEWLIDNSPVASGAQTNLAPQEETTKSYQWTWGQGAHSVEFRVDPQNQIAEISKTNNNVKDYTQALSIGFWVEKAIYDFFNQNQYSYCQDKSCAGSNSWEDWAQRQIKEWNRLFETANPQITTKVRLDKIIVVDNCALPLAGGWASNTPDMRDKAVDLMWGFTSGGITDQTPCGCQREGGNCNFYNQHPEFQNLEHPLMHELSHARNGLPDQYGLNVYRDKDVIEVTDDQGKSAWDYFASGNQVYTNKTQDLMDHPGNHFYREYNIFALNSFAGQRNQCTNYNPNHCWPLVTSNLPTQNILQVRDKNVNLLAGARLKIFQMQRAPGFYAKKWDKISDFEGTTDNQGLIDIGHNPFGGNNPECSNFRDQNECLSSNNWLLLLMIISGSQTEFQFFEYTDVNVAYWKGNTSRAVFEIRTALPPFTPTITPRPSQTPTPPQGGTLSFKIKFQGVNVQRGNQRIKVMLKEHQVFENVLVTSNNQGVYSGTVGNITLGTYEVLVKSPSHLQKNFGQVAFTAGQTTTKDWSEIPLKAGDAVNNNRVDIFDYNKVVEHFGPRMPTGGSPADFDLDNDVDIFDYNYLVGNFGQVGD